MKYLLALLFLAVPAFAGKTELFKTPACHPGAVVFQVEPDIRFIGQPINIFKALETMRQERLKKPCDMKGRVRSKADGKCYKRSRLP